MEKLRHIVVTGGAGFVGSCIAIRLKGRFPAAEVWALDNLQRRGSELNLPRLAEAGVRFMRGDVRKPGDLLPLPEFELLVECSADPSVHAGAACSAGFTPDPWGWGCLEVSPRDPCTGATRERLGFTTCQPVGDCAADFPPARATWGPEETIRGQGALWSESPGPE